MSEKPIKGTGAGSGSDVPRAVRPADAAAVVSGALPRGATGAVWGGLSGPGRMLAAYSWLASTASSAAPIGKSLSASTDRYSLVLMELVHGDVVEHAERIVGENRQGRVQGDQIGRDRRLVDAGEPHRKAWRLLAYQPRLEQSDDSLAFLAGTHQDDLGLAILHRHLVGRNQRNPAPGDELRAEQAHDNRRHATVGGLAAERGDAEWVGQEEARRLPDLGDQRVQVVGSCRTAPRLNGLFRSHLREQAVLRIVDQLGL